MRPTTDYAKEALFNILEHTFDFEGMEVLDLFAGTGSISYEFASRGCKSITAVDMHQGCITFITDTAKNLSFDHIRVVRSDVFRFLRYNKKPFGIVFADPPFVLDRLAELPALVLNRKILAEGGRFILEHPGTFDFSGHEFFSEQRNYGGVNFSFFDLSMG